MPKNCEHRETSYGFLLIRHEEDSLELEMYGQTGYGRYECFASMDANTPEEIEELIVSLEEEYVFRPTAEKLS